MPSKPPMGEVQVRGPLGQAASPGLEFFPIGYHDVTLLRHEGHDVLITPIVVGNLRLHVFAPPFWQTANKNPLLHLGSQQVPLEFPIHTPFFDERGP